MILLKRKLFLGPTAERRHIRRFADEADVQFLAIYRRLTRIPFGQKLQDNAITKIRRQRDVCLQRDPFARRARKQIAKTRYR